MAKWSISFSDGMELIYFHKDTVFCQIVVLSMGAFQNYAMTPLFWGGQGGVIINA